MMRKPMLLNKTLTGERVKLVDFKAEYISEQYLSWLCDKDIQPYTNTSEEEKVTRDNAMHFIRAQQLGLGNYFLAILGDEQHIGNCRIGPIDDIARRTDIGIFIGERKYRNQGLGSETLSLGCRYCFCSLGLHKITFFASALNTAALRMGEKNGFIPEGVLHDHEFYDGRFVNVCIMSKINPF